MAQWGMRRPSPLLETALLLCACALSPWALGQTAETHQHSFGDAAKWAKVFDDPARDAWQKPHEVIQALALSPDSAVADIGSGTGYFAARLVHFVPKGRVFGVDVEPDMVKYLAERAKKEGLRNLVSVRGEPGDPRLPAKVDVVLLVDVYHHIDGREEYFRKLRDSLKPGARVAIVDFRMDAPNGPPAAERIAPDRVSAEMKAAGYALSAEHGFLPYQYFLIFTPARGG